MLDNFYLFQFSKQCLFHHLCFQLNIYNKWSKTMTITFKKLARSIYFLFLIILISKYCVVLSQNERSVAWLQAPNEYL